MNLSRAGRLLLLLFVPACLSSSPRPMSEWEVRSHPLYPPAVWVETFGTRGGGVVVSSSPEGTWVLTAYHVVEGRDGLEVGAFRHSLVDPAPGEPEYDLYRAELVAGGYLLDESIRRPFADLATCFRRILDAGGGAGLYPVLARRTADFARLTEDLDAARERDDVPAALGRFLDTRPLDDSGRLWQEVERAVARASAAAGDPDVGPALGRQVVDAMDAARVALRRTYAGESAIVYDAALLRVRTGDRLIAAACTPAGSDTEVGEEGVLVTVMPDGEPRAQVVRIGEDFRVVGTSQMAGEFRPGNSGSPVFVDGRLTGIATGGLYSSGEAPGDEFGEGVFLRIDTIRRWLARKGLDLLLD